MIEYIPIYIILSKKLFIYLRLLPLMSSFKIKATANKKQKEISTGTENIDVSKKLCTKNQTKEAEIPNLKKLNLSFL